MTTKKIVGIIALIAFCGVGLFVFILHATVKTKSTSLNTYQPYKEWIGKTVTLDKETVLFKEKIREGITRKYPYSLIDSLHPSWEYLDFKVEIGDAVKITTFPAGTKLKLEKAVQYTGGVSGSSTPIVFGTINEEGKTYGVGYPWGKRDMTIDYIRIEKSWLFHKAPWQTDLDTTHYALPRANWW